MKVLKNGLIASTFGFLSLAASLPAVAEYRLTAFGETLGYSALVAKDAEAANEVFDSRNTYSMDFLEVNNLCLSKILIEDFPAAILNCEAALEKAESSLAFTTSAKEGALASIYSNLAVAKALSGDMESAATDLRAALELNGRDANALANSRYIASNLIASN